MTTRMADLVEFPGQPTLRAGSAVPPVRIVLPLAAEPRRTLCTVLAAGTGLVAAIALLGAAMLALVLWSQPSPKDIAFCAILLPAMLAMGVVMAGTAATLVIDCARTPPAVVITAEGLYDRRVRDEIISWSDVIHAQAWPGQPALSLRLRRDVKARHNPFRFGPACRKWRRRANEVHISVLFLTVSPHDLVLCITTLVRRHGCTVEWDLGLWHWA
jgi:hypothetical protein